MAVLPIRITGDPVLHSPALPVETIDDELRALVRDMFETMDAAPGVGLAGPQVGGPDCPSDSHSAKAVRAQDAGIT